MRQCGGLGGAAACAAASGVSVARAAVSLDPSRVGPDLDRTPPHDPADPSSRTPRRRIPASVPVASADNFLLLAKHTLHTQARQANQHHDIHTLRTDAQTGEKHPTHTRQGP